MVGRFLFDPDNQVPIQISGLDFRKRNHDGSWRRRRPDEILVRNVQSLAVCHEDVKRLEGSAMDALVDDVEDALSRYAGLEVPSVKLGEMVMDRLRGLDRVAFVRFASVYRNFQDAGEFQEFVDEMTVRQEREALRRIQEELPF
jgi:transcriptional regulator NrdR family protein